MNQLNNNWQSFQDWRTYLDWRLLLEEFPRDFALLGLVGLLIGLITAFIMWYRSARLIGELEAERVRLTAGDIDIDEAPVERPLGAARSGTGDLFVPPVSREFDEAREETSRISPSTVAAAGSAAAAAMSGSALGEENDEIEAPTEPDPHEIESAEDDFRLATVYSEAPEDADDLTLLDGIDDERAAELNRAGIYKFSQLGELGDDERRKFAFKFGWPDINWAAWTATAAATAAGGALLAGNREEDQVEEADPQVDSLDATAPVAIHVSDSQETGAQPEDDTFTFRPIGEDEMNDPDDLTLLEGVDEERAAELRSAGFYKLSQLEDLSEEDRLRFSRRFNWPDINWGAWAATAAAGGAGALLLREREEESETEETASPSEEETDSDWSWEHDSGRPGHADDFTQIGLSEEDARRLNAQGVYTFKQLEELPGEKRAEVNSKFGWDDIDWGKWGTLTAIGTAAAAGGAALSSDQDEREEDEVYKFKKLDGETEVAVETPEAEAEDQAEKENSWGDFKFGKWGALGTAGAAAGAAALQKKGESDPAEKPETVTFAPDLDTSDRFGELALSDADFIGEIEENFTGESIEVHPRYGIIYPVWPERIDDLTKVRGIGLATEKRLNRNGIYRYKQIGSWNAAAVEGISTDLELGTRIRDDEWISQARILAGDLSLADEIDETDYTGLIDSHYAGEPVEFKPGLGVLYHQMPDDPDDLTEIKGIGNSLEAKLNDYGVFRFQQIADWNETNAAAFNDRLSFSGRIERDEWIPQAKRLAARAEEEANWVADESELELPELSAYNGVVAKFPGESVEVHRDLGVIYKARPSQADDLKQIWGIGTRVEQKLNHLGVYRFTQIADWNDYNVRELNQRLDFKGRIERDEWIAQAKRLAEENDALHEHYSSLLSSEFASEPVTVKPRYGVVYTRQPDDVDDLTEINGIGPVLEKQLNDSGVYRFIQIANWDADAIEAFEDYIDFPGRITRDEWIPQAREFVGAIGSVTPGEEAEPEKPAKMDYLPVLDLFDGERVDVDDQFGVVYTGRPGIQDDLKRIRGVGKFLEGELNSRGVYRFKQVANWNDYNVWAFGKDLAFPGRITREEWVSQAEELAELEEYREEAETLAKTKYSGQSVRVDPELGVVYRKRPDRYDDLTELDGIDENAAARLNSDGIYTFEQVNGLKGPQRRSFLSRFGLGEVDWEKWAALTALGVGATSAIAIAGDTVEDDQAGEPQAEIAPPPADREDPAGEAAESEEDDSELKGLFGIGDADDGDAAAPGGEDAESGGAITHSFAKRRVVFIMDVSRSLTPAQLRLSKAELSSAVRSLPGESLYQVIFFSGPSWFAHQRMIEGGARGEDVVISDGDHSLNWRSGFGGFEFQEGNENLPQGEWREATPENIEATLQDIEAVDKSYGTTWHLPLTMALNLDPAPKNIYFLTDGETARQDQVAEEMIELSKARGGQTKINTIALMVPGASAPLHRIATGTGGEYSLVVAGGKVLKDQELRDYLADKDIALDD